MRINNAQISAHNELNLNLHTRQFALFSEHLEQKGIDSDNLISQINALQVAIPSWALGTGGTRFGRFPGGGEPRNLEEKIDDVGLIHALTKAAGAISLHIPWDIPKNPGEIKSLAASHGLIFDAVNSNTFQDQSGQLHSYKFGSLCSSDDNSRKLAIDHNIEVIEYGKQLGSKSITVWLADGTSFPGQANFRHNLFRTRDSLKEIYQHLPADWQMFIEYKPYEPNFYSTVIQDWGTSHFLAQSCGEKAYCLVDLGHHLPNTNIEQIVATLLGIGKLGGFHFNDSKYGDDDLSVGSIKPYQLFLIFHELVWGMANNEANNPPIAYMIDASHNLKDPIEDLIQSLEAIRIAHAKALLIDHQALAEAQQNHDPALAQEILQEAFQTDVRPLVREARLRNGAALSPIDCFRELKVRENLIDERGKTTIATGL
ncbi:MAG: sugar isomerase [Bacteroidetes bacterium]|nr:sugar isomerase [Bacteroidota bacterium]